MTIDSFRMLQHKLFTYLKNKTLVACVENIELWWIMGEQKLSDENQRFDWIKSINWYLLVNIGWLTDIDLLDSMIWLA